jgi:hypothetical protein
MNAFPAKTNAYAMKRAQCFQLPCALIYNNGLNLLKFID